MSEAQKLKDRASHCRDLARVTRDEMVQKELLRLADEFDAEAEKVAEANASKLN